MQAGIAKTIKYLTNEDPFVVEASLRILINLGFEEQNATIIRTEGGIEPLVEFLKSDDEVRVMMSAWALSNLALNEANQQFIGHLYPFPVIISLLSNYDNYDVTEKVMWLTTNLSQNEQNRSHFVDNNILSTLKSLLSYYVPPLTKLRVLTILRNFMIDEPTKHWFLREEGIQILLNLFETPLDDLHSQSAILLAELASHNETRQKITEKEEVVTNIAKLIKTSLTAQTKLHAIWALINLALDPEVEKIFNQKSMIITNLVDQLTTTSYELRREIAILLTNISLNQEIRVKIRDCGGLAVISDLLDLSVAQSDRSQSDSEEIPMYINRHGSNLDRSIHLEAIRLITNLSIDENNRRILRSMGITEKISKIIADRSQLGSSDPLNHELIEAGQTLLNNLSVSNISNHREQSTRSNSPSPLRQISNNTLNSSLQESPNRKEEGGGQGRLLQRNQSAPCMDNNMAEALQFINDTKKTPRRQRQIDNYNNNASNNNNDVTSLSSPKNYDNDSNISSNNNNNDNNSNHNISNNNSISSDGGNNSSGSSFGFIKRKPSSACKNDFFSSKPGHITQVLLVDTKSNERNIRRSNIANEMLDTEKSYLSSLRILIDEFYHPLKESAKLPKPLISDQSVKMLFSHVELIYNINAQFCEQLTIRVANWAEEQLIGDIFLHLAKMLPMYSEYINNYSQAMEHVSVLVVDNPAFKEFLDSKQFGAKCKGMPISAFMITPIQRIPRYSLLLQDLLSNTPEEHPDFQNISMALKNIKSTADYLNEQKRHSENLLKVLTVHQTLEGFKDTLVIPGRIYLSEGTILEAGKGGIGGGSEYRYLFLFSDLLIITKQRKNKFRYRESVILIHLKVLNLPDSEVLKNGFRLIYHNVNDKTEKQITFFTSTLEEKDKWLHNLNDAVKTRKMNDFNFKKEQSKQLNKSQM